MLQIDIPILGQTKKPKSPHSPQASIGTESTMLRSLRALSQSAILASCTRMLNHATQASCGTSRFPNLPEKVADPIWAVKYICHTNTIADDVRSLLILPGLSIASDPSCNLRFAVVVSLDFVDNVDNVVFVDNVII